MQEYVGKCVVCQREIYCLDGFLNGVTGERGELYCFQCGVEKVDDKK